MSGLINKVKEAMHSDKPATGVNDPEGTHGPHSSRVANAADPRIDSDRDNSHAAGTHAAHNTHTGHTGGITGTSGHTGGLTGTTSHNTTGIHSNVTGYDDPTGTHGPHSSRLANAADPRVDSDRDHRGAPGNTGFGTTGASHNTTTGHTGGLTGTSGHTGGLTGSSGHTGGLTGTTGHNTTGTHSNVTGYDDPTGTHGTHNSRLANAADPRIDSDRDHRAAPGAAGTSHLGAGPGPAPNTAGPHSKDILNKVDPRVDSDLDGSKTVGGNKTLS